MGKYTKELVFSNSNSSSKVNLGSLSKNLQARTGSGEVKCYGFIAFGLETINTYEWVKQWNQIQVPFKYLKSWNTWKRYAMET